jgi:hypothetical protein
MRPTKARHFIFPLLSSLVPCEHLVIYCGDYFCLLNKNTFTSSAMVSGTCAPQAKSKPFHKHTANDLEMKTRMIRKYEERQSWSATARDLGFALSTVNTTKRDAAHMPEHVKGMIMMKSMITTNKREGTIREMGKFLRTCMEATVQKHTVS